MKKVLMGLFIKKLGMNNIVLLCDDLIIVTSPNLFDIGKNVIKRPNEKIKI